MRFSARIKAIKRGAGWVYAHMSLCVGARLQFIARPPHTNFLSFFYIFIYFICYRKICSGFFFINYFVHKVIQRIQFVFVLSTSTGKKRKIHPAQNFLYHLENILSKFEGLKMSVE